MQESNHFLQLASC